MEDIFDTEGHNEKVRIANQDYVDNLRKAIAENQIYDYFKSFGFKPRFLEIIDVLLCFDDGEQMILKLYDYIFANLSDVHVSCAVEKLVKIEIVRPLLIRDFDTLLERSIKSQTFSNNLYIFVQAMIEIDKGEMLLYSNMNNILESTHPTLVFATIKLFEGKYYYSNLIKNNFDKWLLLSRGEATVELVKYMLKADQEYTINYLKENFETVLANVGGGIIHELLGILFAYKELLTLVKDNIEIVIDESNANDINILLENFDTKYNLGIEKSYNILSLLKTKLSKEKRDHLAIGAIVKSKQNDYLKEILTKLIAEENATDFISIGDNSWSNIVFKIGKKVLKFGWIRNNPNCPDLYRIINPDFFQVIKNKEGIPVLYIEIQSYLDQKNITEADIEDFYTDIENEGLIYIDPKGKNPTNFGWLNDNDEELPNTSETFKKRKLVLIDRDCVWHKDDPNICYMSSY